MQWAAACSVAQVIAGRDHWVDTTAMHEARVGAYESAIAAVQGDPDSAIPAAIAGVRRALYWERRARSQLVPPASLGARRWRNRLPDSEATWLVPLSTNAQADGEYAAAPAATMAPIPANRETRIVDPIAERLVADGWGWPIPAEDAVNDAIQAVLAVGRERAAACFADLHHGLPTVVSEGLVMLVAGSRTRTSRPWPGMVWLARHRGLDKAFDDPGARLVIDAVISGRAARPACAPGAEVVKIGPRRRSGKAISARHREATGAAKRPQVQGAARGEVAS